MRLPSTRATALPRLRHQSGKECRDDAGAFVASKYFVETKLKSPGSADFPFLDYQHAARKNCQILIRSYVDSQNGFGAMIRSHYDAVLQHRGGEWQLVSLRIK